MKRLLRGALLLVVLVAVALAVCRRRGRCPGTSPAQPPPAPPSGPTASPIPPPAASDDLTRVRGIGPVYAARLAEADLATFSRLAAADPAAVGAAAGVPPDRAAGWIAQAAELASR